MLNLNVRTKRNPAEVIREAQGFFGPGGYGLKIVSQNDTGAYFEGGGGGIKIAACTDDQGTSVDLETREWESQVEEFARRIK